MGSTTIQVSKRHRDELELLRIAWGLKSLDEVIGEFLKRHRPEELKALGIQVEEK